MLPHSQHTVHTMQAYQVMQELSLAMNLQPLSAANDLWVYSWGPVYTASRYYK
jgi:hypothetical protein